MALQPSRPAALLAALLLHANSVVSAEFLQRVIWGVEPPAQAKSALHSCVLRLRRLFGKYGIAPGAIEAVPGGYRLIADAATLDLVEFRELLDRAYSRRDPETELRLLRAALALWQPPLMANVHSDLLHRDEVPRLREEWLRAIERVFDLELACGRHREALAEIGATARAHPLHERFTEQLMEALRRVGRRAEALAEYRRTKVHLAQQLGVDPGPALQRLELDILRGEPESVGPAHAARGPVEPGSPAGTAGPGGSTGSASWADGRGAPTAGRNLAAGQAGGQAAGAAPGRYGSAAPGAATAPDTAASAGPAPGTAAPGAPPGRSAPAEDRAAPGCAEQGAPGDPAGPDRALVPGDRMLDRLVCAGLLQEGPHGHYRMHELLSAFTRAATADGVGARARSGRRTPAHSPRPGAADLHPTEA
ncbi:BTAD domain-containing putative transcriptional regulator [Actinacidiphila polyblastidii]|uniref:BTAD domain-containing putative transcriptional regulator n=1 Tax=Actinacidiphila polyblastidii TaxID=3110430 RepID=UPI0039BD3191